ncbi:MAG: hypothetical protein R2825_20555 [Saprospiraceae bacterium]
MYRSLDGLTIHGYKVVAQAGIVPTHPVNKALGKKLLVKPTEDGLEGMVAGDPCLSCNA